MNPSKTKTFLFAVAVLASVPLPVFALTFEDLVDRFIEILNMLIPVLIVLALIAFIFGVVKYLFLSQGQPDQRAEGAKFMTYGVVALFVMISVWGLVAILQNTVFGGTTPGFDGPPQIETNSSGSGGSFFPGGSGGRI